MTDDPLAYFLTWTCYGTWLPGDERGWMKWHKGDQLPQPLLADWCREQMVEKPVVLNETHVRLSMRRFCGIASFGHGMSTQSTAARTIATSWLRRLAILGSKFEIN